MTLRLRLTLWYSSILAITLLAFGAGLYTFLNIITIGDIKESLKRQANEVTVQVSRTSDMSLKLSLNPRDVLGATNTFLQVVDYYNNKASRSANMITYNLQLPFNEATKKKLDKEEEYFERISIDGVEMLLYNTELSPYGGQTLGALQVATIIETQSSFLNNLKLLLALTSLLTILIAGTVGLFMARKALRPIDQVVDAANQIEKGTDLGKRIQYEGKDAEILRLTDTINSMLSRIQTAYTDLEEAYGTQRRFVSDASHELRTPLTTIRGNVELLDKMWKQAALTGGQDDTERMEMSLEAMQDIAAESERMSRLINDMLSLARADAGVQITLEPFEIGPLVDEVARRAGFLPKKADWVIGDLSLLEGIQISGHRDYMQQLLFIFIENAFKYTEDGYVKLDAVRTDRQIGLRIEDSGIGMDKEEVPRIFDRFYRADVSRGKTAGTGLGLSIAKWIIDAHKGSIEVKTRKDEGTTFIIWLPVFFPPALH